MNEIEGAGDWYGVWLCTVHENRTNQPYTAVGYCAGRSLEEHGNTKDEALGKLKQRIDAMGS